MQDKAKEGGLCYEESAKLLMKAEREMPGGPTVMVHAAIINSMDGEPMGHAWVEFEMDPDEHGGKELTVCIDPAHAERTGSVRPIPREIFYRLAGVDMTTDYYRYSHVKMLSKLAEHEHFGPWDLEVGR